MTTSHSHNHAHLHAPNLAAPLAQRRLILAIAVTAATLLLEVVGGVLANSLALLSDSGHVLTDLAALLLSFIALRLAARPATSRKTFGFHRFEILSALVNGVTLVGVSLLIFFEAYRRLRNPEPVQGLEVHLVGDAISSVGVILSGVIIMLTGWWVVDPLVSIGIGLIIIGGAIRLIDESVDVLLEGTPRHVDLQEVMGLMIGVPGVCSVHDLHVWCVTPQLCIMSGHVILDLQANVQPHDVLSQINHVLAERYGIRHTTIQVEHEHCGQDDVAWLAAK